MEILRLSTKGQIVIPKTVRRRHRWEAGTELILEERGDALILRAANPFPPTSIEEGLGCSGYRGQAMTIQQMDDAVGDAFQPL
jgi:AbrB family looped-hinge helix DNA binding protein